MAGAEPEEDWPFDQPRNCATLTLRQIVKGELPILSVYHDAEDHDWQFLHNGTPREEDASIVALEEIVQIDRSVLEIADIPPGWVAWRAAPAAPWRRTKNQAAGR